MSGFLCLTAMAALATTIMQKLFVAIDYFQATENDPFAALPLNLNELIDNMTASLKAMFASMIIFWTTIWTGADSPLSLDRLQYKDKVGCWLTGCFNHAAKYSILFFVKRIVNGLPGYMQAWWACFTLVTMLYVACIVSLFMTCMPLQKYWTSKLLQLVVFVPDR